MDSVLDGGGQLERAMKPDPVAAPVTGSVLLHAFILVGIPLFLYLNGMLHHSWGAPGPGGAIQVSLDSAALRSAQDRQCASDRQAEPRTRSTGAESKTDGR
jgi:hypothetical protein